MTDKMLEQQRRRMDWAERDDRMVEEIGHGPQPDAVYDPETGSEYQPSPTHKAICYDDEGRLECCCELRPMIETRSQQPKEATHETD